MLRSFHAITSGPLIDRKAVPWERWGIVHRWAGSAVGIVGGHESTHGLDKWIRLCDLLELTCDFRPRVEIFLSWSPIEFGAFVSGNELMKKEEFAQALECYSEAIKADNTNAVYYCNRFF